MGIPSISVHKGACGWCVKLFKWIPVAFISTIVIWSYYAYVVHLCFLTIRDDPVFIGVLLLFYHVFFVLFVWSYWKTVFTPPGFVPSHFRLTGEDLDNVENSSNPKETLEQIVIEKDLPVSMRSVNGEVRYCGECSYVKPDRCHHCSVCGTCVLKMDHHCPWVNNCVAFYNYKFFVLFLSYALIYCLFIAFSSLKYFLLFWSNGSPAQGKFHVLFLFFVSAMFSVSLFSLFGYHCYLISRNLTTLEAFRAPVFRSGRPDKLGFHLGKYNNFQEIFGDRKSLWFIPVFTSMGDGMNFPQRGQLDEDYDDDEGRGQGQQREGGRHSTSCVIDIPEEQVPMMQAQDKWDDEDDEYTNVLSRKQTTNTINSYLSSTTSSSSSGSSHVGEELGNFVKVANGRTGGGSAVADTTGGAIIEPSTSVSVDL